MTARNLDALTSEAQQIRLALARDIVERCHSELGEHLLAAAIYASVAHSAALPHSDLELVLLTDESVPAREDMTLERGVMVEADMLPASRMLVAASRVTPRWGIEADQYRHHLVLWDPGDIFPGILLAASTLTDEAFTAALAASWWTALETRGKTLNGALAEDAPRLVHSGWGFAYWTAMRIALRERLPYQSERTIWSDVSARGYGMATLVHALTSSAHEHVPGIVEDVWQQTWSWGAPAGYVL